MGASKKLRPQDEVVGEIINKASQGHIMRATLDDDNWTQPKAEPKHFASWGPEDIKAKGEDDYDWGEQPEWAKKGFFDLQNKLKSEEETGGVEDLEQHWPIFTFMQCFLCAFLWFAYKG